MNVKTSDLIGFALDWAVALCEGKDYLYKDKFAGKLLPYRREYSTDWAQGGPIIEREGIELLCNLTAAEASKFKNAHADWQAFYRQRRATHERSFGTTPLVAAMRCYVESKFGNEVDVPDELRSK